MTAPRCATAAIEAPVAGLTLTIPDGSLQLDAGQRGLPAPGRGRPPRTSCQLHRHRRARRDRYRHADITLTGTNDAPVAVADTATAGTEAPATRTARRDQRQRRRYGATHVERQGASNARSPASTLNHDRRLQATTPKRGLSRTSPKADHHGRLATTPTPTITARPRPSTLTTRSPAPTTRRWRRRHDTAARRGHRHHRLGRATNDSDVDDGASCSSAARRRGRRPDAQYRTASYSFDAGERGLPAPGGGRRPRGRRRRYTVTDEHGATETATLTITLTGTNDAPVAVADTDSGRETPRRHHQPGHRPLGNDSDVDTASTPEQPHTACRPYAAVITARTAATARRRRCGLPAPREGRHHGRRGNYTVTDDTRRDLTVADDQRHRHQRRAGWGGCRHQPGTEDDAHRHGRREDQRQRRR